MEYIIKNKINYVYESSLIIRNIILDYKNKQKIHIEKKLSHQKNLVLLQAYDTFLQNVYKDSIMILKRHKAIFPYFKLKGTIYQQTLLCEILLGTNKDVVSKLTVDNFRESLLYNLKTEENIFKSIKTSYSNSDDQVLIYELIYNTEEILNEIKNLLLEISQIIKKYLYIIEEILKIYNHIDNLENYVHDSVIFQEKYSSRTILNMEGKQKLLFYHSVMDYTTVIIFMPCKENYIFMCEGVFARILDHSSFKEQEESIKEKIKALGDDTRFALILLLKEKNFFLSELSNKLSLSPATISHHAQILLKANLITIVVEGRKTFYKINHEKIHELAKWLDVSFHEKIGDIHEK